MLRIVTATTIVAAILAAIIGVTLPTATPSAVPSRDTEPIVEIVEVPVEVEKIVEVPVIVEREVEKIVEVPVVEVVERIVEVPVPSRDTERVERLQADLDMAHEVLTQAARFEEDGSGVVEVWAYDGPDGFLHSAPVTVCIVGDLCDDSDRYADALAEIDALEAEADMLRTAYEAAIDANRDAGGCEHVDEGGWVTIIPCPTA